NTSIDFFNLLVTDELLELIARETNIYAEEVFLSGATKEKSRITRWKDVTVEELRIFIGLVLHLGTIRLNRLQDYWKTHRLFNLPAFKNYMSRDRFMLIFRCLHFSKNPLPGQEKSTDSLYKIRPLIDYFNSRMSDVYYPGKELSLDESMVLWRDRLIFRQYIKNKRHKYGVKLYLLTEPDGIVQKFAVYTGTGTIHKQEVKKPKAVVEYNNFMGGIDRKDQMMAYYPCERKTMRLYKKLGIHIIYMSLINSFFIYKKFMLERQVLEKLLPETEGPSIEKNQMPAKHVPKKILKPDRGKHMHIEDAQFVTKIR
ncbi:hypothetical protein NQ315_004682, partial [Exocentrus adspersus]